MAENKTLSELAFERFCETNNIQYARVQTEDGHRNPDYEAYPSGHRTIVEVKELIANEVDAQALQKAGEARVGWAWTDYSKRVGRKIGDAARQLKQRSAGECPTMVVLFDNGTFGGVDSTDIKNAMYGHEVVSVTITSNTSAAVEQRLGGGRKCTPTDNRSLSAAGLMWDTADGPRLSIFHNVFAGCPLPVDWFGTTPVRQYTIDLDAGPGMPEWREAHVEMESPDG